VKKLVLFILLLSSAAVFSFTQQKFALVIGNGNYTDLGRLNNPLNDANDMEAALRNLGFTVEKVLDGSIDQMESAIIRLKNRLSVSKNSYGFFFYAGHGVQSGGSNYLIPAGARIPGENFLRERAVSVQSMLAELNDAGNELNIIVLDACRDNPFSWARSGSRGLTVVSNQPADSIIVYATSAGSTAQDGTGRNGLFTSQLLKHLNTPGVEVSELFRLTGADVSQASNRQQIPAVYNQFFGRAYLGSASAANIPAPAPAAAAVQPVPATQTPAPAVTSSQAPSAAAQITPAPAAELPVPQNLSADTPGTGSVTLRWDSAGQGYSYRVYWSTQNDLSRAAAFNNSIYGTSFFISNMSANTNYYFWVVSVRNRLESVKSAVISINKTTANPIDMVRINGGTFMMGSPSREAGRRSDETQHRVTVSSFYMGRYEITQKEYQEVMGANPSYFIGDNLPVEMVTWFDAIEFCNNLSQIEGLTPTYTITGRTPVSGYPITAATVTWNREANGYRLPTEAEWEYACRAGTTTAYNTGNTINTNTGWYSKNSNSRTQPVGQKPANAWGLFDMHGNVWEWCWDWYGTYPSSAQTDPVGTSAGSCRVYRGGAFITSASSVLSALWRRYLSAADVRSAYRGNSTPTSRIGCIGFRVVRN